MITEILTILRAALEDVRDMIDDLVIMDSESAFVLEALSDLEDTEHSLANAVDALKAEIS